MRLPRALAALVLLAALLHGVVGVGAQTGGIGIRLVEVPTSRKADPRARTYVVDHLAQGRTIQRRVEVSNGASGAVRVRLYTGGATIEGGTFRPDDQAPSDLSRWTTLTPDHIDLAAGAKAQATVRIAVPAGAGAGERYGVVWAELPPNQSPGGGVALVNRVGVRIYLSVGTGSEPPTDFRIETLTARRDTQGRPAISAQVRNVGGRALDLRGELRLADGPGGIAAGPFPAQLGTTLGLHQAEPVTVLLDRRLPAGPWRARLTLRSGTVARSVKALITFPSRPGTSSRPVTATPIAKRRAVLLPVAGGLLVLALALLGVVGRRRRRGAS